VAVALETGLIVPVIKSADEKNLMGIARSIQDLALRARTKQLKPEEVQGGTFTITNPGIFGALFWSADHQPAAGCDSRGAVVSTSAWSWWTT
jgi:2-oxoglutarate dehydrogenase E2 component (dihydrolipoamide succinyltransferase)